jgi:hypothetical protein
MPAHFEPDPALCQKYAQFASRLDRRHFVVLYWFMFVANLAVLFFGSWVYIKYVAGQPGSIFSNAFLCGVELIITIQGAKSHRAP